MLILGFAFVCRENIWRQWKTKFFGTVLLSGLMLPKSTLNVIQFFLLPIIQFCLHVTGVFKVDFCVSVEIKPKCGFLPNPEVIVEENAVKKSVTRFRLHQALKLHQRKISQISKYDA